MAFITVPKIDPVDSNMKTSTLSSKIDTQSLRDVTNIFETMDPIQGEFTTTPYSPGVTWSTSNYVDSIQPNKQRPLFITVTLTDGSRSLINSDKIIEVHETQNSTTIMLEYKTIIVQESVDVIHAKIVDAKSGDNND